VPLQRSRTAGGQHLAVTHGCQPIEALGFFQVGACHQHAHHWPTRSDARDQGPELTARQWVNTGGRLIENQQIRIVNQRAAQAQLLFHVTREFADRTPFEGSQSGGAEQFVAANLALLLVVSEQAPEKIHIFSYRQRRIEIAAQALWHVSDAPAHPAAASRPCHIAAQHHDAPLLNPGSTDNQGQQRRLADAVRANESCNTRSRNSELRYIEHQRLAIAMT
jgi:hypothetical protein